MVCPTEFCPTPRIFGGPRETIFFVRPNFVRPIFIRPPPSVRQENLAQHVGSGGLHRLYDLFLSDPIKFRQQLRFSFLSDLVLSDPPILTQKFHASKWLEISLGHSTGTPNTCSGHVWAFEPVLLTKKMRFRLTKILTSVSTPRFKTLT